MNRELLSQLLGYYVIWMNALGNILRRSHMLFVQ